MQAEEPNSSPTNQPHDAIACFNCAGILWWAKLVVAVLAVPSVAVVMGVVAPFGDLGKTIVFVLTCWLCVWLGMHLMQKAQR